MPEVKSKKVDDSSNQGFTETIKFKVLHCGNVEGNNNKFYCLEIQKAPRGHYRIFSHYGRLGKTNVYEERVEMPNGDALTDLAFVEHEFDAVLNKKMRGKKVKDDDGTERIEKYEEVKTIKPTVGSENICGKTFGDVTVVVGKKIDTSTYTDPTITRIIDQVVNENIHNITTLTSLKLTSTGFETPLGPVTKDHIDNAREPLNLLKSKLVKGKLNPEDQQVRLANNKFYSLIPHSFGHKILQTDWILDDVKLMNEFDLLEQLESAVQMGSALNQNATNRLNALGCEIEVLKDKNEFERIKRYQETTRAQNHPHIWNWKVKNVLKIKIPFERQRFEQHGKSLGNIKELFHGSRNCNILSILKNGLIVPPCNAPNVSGRMFSDGLYFAHNSTKSLNYSLGAWAGTRNKFDNAFLFMANVAMGKFFECESARYSGAPAGYNSIHAKKGLSLKNDEYIVYSLSQSTLTYLLELNK